MRLTVSLAAKPLRKSVCFSSTRASGYVGTPSGSRLTMRKKTAFNESHFWENIGMFVFVVAGLVALWYVMSNILTW